MRFTSVFALIISLVSCSNADSKHSVTSNTYTDTTDIVDDKFITRVLDTNSSICIAQILESKKLNLDIKTSDSINLDDRTLKDSIFVLFNHRDTLVYGKAYSGIFLWRLHLQTSNLTIDTTLTIDCKKNMLARKFNLSDIANVVRVRDEMGTNTFYFIFSNNILKEIVFYCDFEGVN